jgi:hypothetical protein
MLYLGNLFDTHSRDHPLSIQRGEPTESTRPAMQDLAMLLFTVVFFALAFLYVKACQKLR